MNKAIVSFDKDQIKFKKPHHHVKCSKCDAILALIGSGGLIIKSVISFRDLKKLETTVKCGKCKNYNTFPDDIQKDETCLLVI